MKFGCQGNYHEGQAAKRHYANLSLMTFASASQFHVYLPWVNVCLSQLLKYESASWHFPPGEGPSRGLIRDCEIFACLRITLVCSSSGDLEWAVSQLVSGPTDGGGRDSGESLGRVEVVWRGAARGPATRTINTLPCSPTRPPRLGRPGPGQQLQLIGDLNHFIQSLFNREKLQ